MAGWAWALFIIAGVVFAVVLALLLFALLRRSRGGAYHQALPEAQERRWFRFVLVAGGIVPALTLATVMGLNVFSERKVAQEARRPTLTIQVIGHQFWWELRYPQAGFTGANELHIPVGQPVRLELASADVIHSFWVPQLSPKTDMIPGQTNILTLTASRPGLYRGQCAEFCGAQHAHMIFTVVAQEPADYAAWLARERKPANPAALTARP